LRVGGSALADTADWTVPLVLLLPNDENSRDQKPMNGKSRKLMGLHPPPLVWVSTELRPAS